MQTRREMLTHSATVAGLLAASGLLPAPAQAAWAQAAFEARTMADGKVLYAAKEITVTLGGCGG